MCQRYRLIAWAKKLKTFVEHLVRDSGSADLKRGQVRFVNNSSNSLQDHDERIKICSMDLLFALSRCKSALNWPDALQLLD